MAYSLDLHFGYSHWVRVRYVTDDDKPMRLKSGDFARVSGKEKSLSNESC
jgi:hypothetical protein